MMKEERLSYYITQSKIIDLNSYEKEIKIAILGSFTLNGLSEVLQVKCRESKIKFISHVGEYNQYAQEILNPKSNLYQFKPDITFLLLDVLLTLIFLFISSSISLILS